jgi:dTDP-4-amino-4,6-dideoxygalactose transaminase
MPTLALNGGPPTRTDPWPTWPISDEREEQAVLEVLRSGKWWYGEKVQAFEAAFAAFQDAAYGVSCTSGTAALKLGLLAAGVGAGDEVIVPPYTFVATAAAPLLVNAVPVFADVELDTANLDPAAVEAAITPRTKAIMPVHFAGLPADMDALTALARRHNLALIEDACHAWGTKWNGKGAGALGDCGAFSFQMSKNMTAGEGGLLLTDREDLADRARSYSNFGRMAGQAFYEHYLLGDNMRLTEMQAALLLVQLSRLEAQTALRHERASLLTEELASVPGLALTRDDNRARPRSWHLYMFRFQPEQWGGLTRDRFLEAMRAEGIPVSAGYPLPLYKNPMFLHSAAGPEGCPVSCPYYGGQVDYTTACAPVTERLCAEMVWLMQTALLADEQAMRDIARAAQKIWDHREKLLQNE